MVSPDKRSAVLHTFVPTQWPSKLAVPLKSPLNCAWLCLPQGTPPPPRLLGAWVGQQLLQQLGPPLGGPRVICCNACKSPSGQDPV